MTDPKSITTVGDDFPRQQQRLRELVKEHETSRPGGSFMVAWLRDLQRRSDEAAISQDIVAILQFCQEMKEAK